jgi:hypothetical protein
VHWRLPIVGSTDPPIDHRINELRDKLPFLRCESISWGSLPLEPISELTADLTLLLAEGAMSQAAELPCARLASSFALPLIAVLPAAAQAGIEVQSRLWPKSGESPDSLDSAA